MEARKQKINQKRLTFRLTAVLAGIVAACVMAEVGLRFHVALFERDHREDLQRGEATIPPRWSGDCSGAKADILAPILRPSDEVGVFYQLKADLDICFTGARVRTNAEGVRSEERHELPRNHRVRTGSSALAILRPLGGASHTRRCSVPY